MDNTVMIRKLSRELAGFKSQLSSLATTQQLPFSTIENGGSITVRTGSGASATDTMQIGGQFDGGYAATPLTGATPPIPTTPILTPIPGGFTVRWDGLFLDSAFAPTDWSRIEVHVGAAADFDTSFAETIKGTIETPRGTDVPVVDLPTGTYWVKLVSRSLPGHRSPDSPAASVTSLPMPSGEDVQQAMDDAAAALTAALAADNAAIQAQADATVALSTANGKSKLWYSTSDPVDEGSDGDMWWTRTGAPVLPEDPPAGQVVKVFEKKDGTWQERTLTSSVIDSITAGQITSGTLAAGTTISVGDTGATHVAIGNSSIQVWRPDVEGNLSPTVSLGGATTDQLLITEPGTGMPIAGIFDSGAIVGNTLDLQTPGGLSLGGEMIEDILWEYARGTRASYRAFTTRPTITTTEYGLFEIGKELPPGRVYRVRFTGNFTHTTANGNMRLWLRVTTDGSEPQVVAPASNQLIMGWFGFGVAGLPMRKSIERMFHVGLDRYGAPVMTRILVSAATLSGTGAFNPDSGVTPGEFIIEDVGPVYEGYMLDGRASGGQGSGGGPANPVVTTYTKEYTASWTRTWRNGSVYAGTTDAMQGSSPWGSHVSQIGFPSTLATDLSGSTIQKLEVYLYANHWEYYDGGIAQLGVHGNASVPASYSSSGSLLWPSSGRWPRGAGRWVTLPTSWHAGFLAGTSRGITLSAPSTSGLYYGRFNGSSATSGKPVFRATFTK